MKKLSQYLEQIDGFVIDLSTDDSVVLELSYVLHDEEDQQDVLNTMTIPEIRELILEYYSTTYYDDYIILKSPYVYQIIEQELFINE